jgi:Protein of unknown function (DUF2569)
MTDSVLNAASTGPKGFGGWLLIPVISTVVMPLFPAFALAELFEALKTADLAAVPGTFWRFLALQLALFIGWLYAIGLMFYRRAAYPRVLIVLMLAIPAVLLVDILAMALAGDTERLAVKLKALGKALIPCLIWVPYMLVSRRVRNTFAN